MVLAKGHWESNHSKLTRVVEIIRTPPHKKTLGQVAMENGFGNDGEQMCNLLVSLSFMSENELQTYRKNVRKSQS